MSAYLCSSETLTEVADLAAAKTGTDAEHTFTILWAANVSSLQARYPNDFSDYVYGAREYIKGHTPPAQEEGRRSAVDTFAYQACEVPNFTETKAGRICAALGVQWSQ